MLTLQCCFANLHGKAGRWGSGSGRSS